MPLTMTGLAQFYRLAGSHESWSYSDGAHLPANKRGQIERLEIVTAITARVFQMPVP